MNMSLHILNWYNYHRWDFQGFNTTSLFVVLFDILSIVDNTDVDRDRNLTVEKLLTIKMATEDIDKLSEQHVYYTLFDDEVNKYRWIVMNNRSTEISHTESTELLEKYVTHVRFFKFIFTSPRTLTAIQSTIW